MNISEKIQYLSIKEISNILSVSENSLKDKIPDKYKIHIGNSVRYELYSVIDYFKHGENKHNPLLDDILN